MLYEYQLLRTTTQPLVGKRMSFEDKVKQACKRHELPGLVLAADGPGKAHYQRAFGTRLMKRDDTEIPLEIDATFSLASCTKLMTTVAALQCVERGLVTLDEDITRVLPELKNLEILAGFDRRTRRPILVRRKRQLTLRHLLTHTSGISHPAWNSRLYEYLTSQSRPVALSCTGRVISTCLYPLVFEPGTSWEYGAGLDWAGKMIERLNDKISLQRYMEIHVWLPLNITTATFRLNERPDLKEKLPEMTFRQGLNHPIYSTTLSPNGRIVPGLDDERDEPVIVEELLDEDHMDDGANQNDDFGGSGVYCSAPDFAKILSSLCTNDGRLLHPSTANEMFLPQLSPPARARLQSFFAIKQINDIFAGGLPQNNTSLPLPLDWGLGGMLVMEDVPASSYSSSGMGFANRRRSKGSMFWAGLPNLYWWMDPKAGVSGFYASQLLPQGDPRSIELFGEFEERVYERAASSACGGGGVKGDGIGMGMGFRGSL